MMKRPNKKDSLKATEDKIKEEARWQITMKKEKDQRLQQLEDQMGLLKARAIKGQGQFPKTTTPRAYASRAPKIPSVGQRVLTQLLEAVSKTPDRKENSLLKKWKN